ncbi:S4 domain protein [Ketogulonicigenium robustum]|uniref:S4 domain protein n=1 Tax=Ketogulonicigenium robustum TaxID=92947 RepID=A0A1W6NXZ1_9RHOB|nr:RNA-binding S4 domain-containing protein [Ketogulonicigenium robustum]ARO13960.1 S4 domain protein [Ketogulonicigenium robustum]
MTLARQTIRIDKWLWHARFCKSRAIAQTLVTEGRLRINGQPTDKPARAVGAADVLTFMQGGRVRVVRVLDIGTRRGPAEEARLLYEDLSEGNPAGDTATGQLVE